MVLASVVNGRQLWKTRYNSVKGGNKVSLKGIGFFFIRSQAEEALHAQIAKGKPNLAPLQSPDLLDDAELLAEDREMDAELTGTDTLSLSLLFFDLRLLSFPFIGKEAKEKRRTSFQPVRRHLSAIDAFNSSSFNQKIKIKERF